MPFIHEDFLLTNAAARRLYHTYAEGEPILDYHCHLPPQDVAGNRRFANLSEIWLEGDHYKWRAMRANGVDERYCTGDAAPEEKFRAWARTVPHTLRNPLYHWTHLELKRYFGIEELLDESTAASRLGARQRAARRRGAARARHPAQVQREGACAPPTIPPTTWGTTRPSRASGLATRVFPTFRPDKALNVHMPAAFNPWVEQLAAAANVEISSFANFLDALKRRHDFFHAMGGRLSDHGLNHCYADFCTEAAAAKIFAKARGGKAATPEEQGQFAAFLMLYFGRLDAEKGWTKQLHLGALRNNNTRGFRGIGPDTGFDSIGDWPQAAALAAYLDRLDQEEALPKIIVYNLNPADNYVLATMVGQLPGRSHRGQDAVRQRLVVPGPERGHGVADQRALERGPAFALRRHADRFAVIHVLPAARIFPARALQPDRPRHRERRDPE